MSVERTLGVDLLQELKHVGRIKEWVIGVSSLSGMEVVSFSKHVEHVVIDFAGQTWAVVTLGMASVRPAIAHVRT